VYAASSVSWECEDSEGSQRLDCHDEVVGFGNSGDGNSASHF